MDKKTNFKKILTLGIIFCALWGGGITAHASFGMEKEPNDTMETAQILQATSHSAAEAVKGQCPNQHTMNGYTNSEDEDWYKVYLNAGEQYVTINGETGLNCDIEVYNSNKILLMRATYTKGELGGNAFLFTASSSGYYYVKIIGTLSISYKYILLVGGPTYEVEHCSVPLNGINMSGKVDREATFNISEAKGIPSNAVVYSILVTGISSFDIAGISVRNITTQTKIDLGRYTMDRDGLVSLNMPVQSEWEFTFKYKKDTRILPTVKFYYVYPLTSTHPASDITIRP